MDLSIYLSRHIWNITPPTDKVEKYNIGKLEIWERKKDRETVRKISGEREREIN